VRRHPRQKHDVELLVLRNDAIARDGAVEAMRTIVRLSRRAKNPGLRLSASLAVVERAWGKPKAQHRHSVDKPITEVDIVGQVDVRRLSHDELRDFERLLDRATVPPPIEARPILTSRDHQD
jgi:hypothetical protein